MSKATVLAQDQDFIKNWPGAFKIYKRSATAIRFNLGTILALLGLSIFLSLAPEAISDNTGMEQLAVFIANILSVIVGLAMTFALLASARSKKMALNEAISNGFSMMAVRYFLMSVLLMVIYIVSFVLLIVPFLFIFPRTLLASYFMVDKDMGPIESIKASWHSTKGHVGKIYRIIGVFILMGFAVFILVGIYFLIMYSAVLALLYLHITHQDKATKASASPLGKSKASDGPIISKR